MRFAVHEFIDYERFNLQAAYIKVTRLVPGLAGISR